MLWDMDLVDGVVENGGDIGFDNERGLFDIGQVIYVDAT